MACNDRYTFSVVKYSVSAHLVHNSSTARIPECYRLWLDKRRLSSCHGYTTKPCIPKGGRVHLQSPSTNPRTDFSWQKILTRQPPLCVILGYMIHCLVNQSTYHSYIIIIITIFIQLVYMIIFNCIENLNNFLQLLSN